MNVKRMLGLNSYETAWAWLHKLHRAMVRPDRDRLQGTVEVDEIYVGGEEEGASGRYPPISRNVEENRYEHRNQHSFA